MNTSEERKRHSRQTNQALYQGRSRPEVQQLLQDQRNREAELLQRLRRVDCGHDETCVLRGSLAEVERIIRMIETAPRPIPGEGKDAVQ